MDDERSRPLPGSSTAAAMRHTDADRPGRAFRAATEERSQRKSSTATVQSAGPCHASLRRNCAGATLPHSPSRPGSRQLDGAPELHRARNDEGIRLSTRPNEAPPRPAAEQSGVSGSVRRTSRFTGKAWAKYLPTSIPGHLRPGAMYRAGARLEAIAEASWEIARGDVIVSRPAIFLPGQLERVTGTAYTYNLERDMSGGIETYQSPTRGYLLKDAWLLDGSLYASDSCFDLYYRSRLSRRQRVFPRCRAEIELGRASIYSTSEGNEYFGLWLTDDCVCYPLARSEGPPVATTLPVTVHIPQYEAMLGMTPVRSEAAYLREVVVFEDGGRKPREWGWNAHKRARFAALRDRLLSQVGGGAPPHPGVFILRRNSGKPRSMWNELEVAERLRDRRGFRIVDVTRDDVHALMTAVAGARVVAGVEGSHLFHGLMALQPGGAMLALQPPNRFSGVIKWTTDPNGLDYAFVVGHPDREGFVVDVDEVERTIDLIAA